MQAYEGEMDLEVITLYDCTAWHTLDPEDSGSVGIKKFNQGDIQ